MNKKYSYPNFKFRQLVIMCMCVFNMAHAEGERDSVSYFYPNFDIKEVHIKGSRSFLLNDEIAKQVEIINAEDLANSPAHTLNDELDYVPGIDMRTRGPLGVQADISVRGGNFEQTAILVNGIKMNEPQTGHNSLNLPVDITSVNRVEVSRGPTSRIFGASAFSGAINVVVLPEYTDYVKAGIAIGQYGLNHLNASLNKNIGKTRHLFTLGQTSTSGYITNTDFSVINLFYSAAIETKPGPLFLQAGYQNKAAGAQNFYTTSFPLQYEQMRTKFASAVYEMQAGNFTFKPKVYIRRSHDRFELYRNGKDYYSFVDSINRWVNAGINDTAYIGYAPNFHMTTVMGTEADISYASRLGTTNLGFEHRNENILSNRMGDLIDTLDAPGETEGYFNREYTRTISGLYIEHNAGFGKLKINTGVLVQFSDDYKVAYFPGIDLKYALNKMNSLYVSANKANRIPSFTELLYSTPTHLSNRGLKQEETTSTELGWNVNGKILKGSFALFYSAGDHLIDWIQDPDNIKLNTTGLPLWESTNISTTKSYGVETAFKLNVNALTKSASEIHHVVFISCSYLSRNVSSGRFLSAYALDYLKNKVNLGWQMNNHNIHFTVMATLFDRNDYYNWVAKSNMEFETYVLLDAKISYRSNKFEMYINATNLSNKKYIDFHGVEMPGIWLKGGVSRKLVLSQHKSDA